MVRSWGVLTFSTVMIMDISHFILALRKVAHSYGCNGNHDSDLIANAFNALANEIESANEEEQAAIDKHHQDWMNSWNGQQP